MIPQQLLSLPALQTLAVLQEDDKYGAWLAQRLDMAAAAVLFVTYNVAIILIFALQVRQAVCAVVATTAA